MALIVETGLGIENADSYVSLVGAAAYWNNRPHTPLSSTWNAATNANLEGALREASAYLDATYGPFYRGHRQGDIQGLLWPRVEAFDERGFLLPAVPTQIYAATCELAARAISSPLKPDATIDGVLKRKREKVDVIEEEVEYEPGSVRREAAYGYVDGLLAPVLNGTQPGAPPQWNWR